MSGHGEPGRCLLVDLSAAEAALLRRLPGQDSASVVELDARLTGVAEPVDLVVIGSLATAPLALVQRVHRLVPDAGVALLTDDVAGIRGQASYAPGVPLDLLVVSAAEDDLVEQLDRLRRSTGDRRRHAAVLAAVVRRAAAADGRAPTIPAAVGSLLEHAPIAVLVAAPSGELLGWNRRGEHLLDLREARTGRSVDTVIPGAVAFMAPLVSGAGAAGGADAAPAPLEVRIAGRVDVELTAVRSQTDDGRPVVLLLATDVTAHRQAERERDRLASQVQLLARVSETLVGSLDVAESLSRLADVLVPALADWTSIQFRPERDQLAALAVRHRDASLAAVARRVEALIARSGVGSEASRRAAAGEAVLFPAVAPATLDDQVPDADLRSLVTQLGTGSVLAVPVPGRGGVLGSLLLARAPGSPGFVRDDMSLATEIGRRAGIALDNARLYAAQRHVATGLQQSLLTEPPELPFADIAVRYVAAAREAQVGGDWYDAFRQRRGDLTVVIGDVVGHDTRAAAAMGQLRSLVRGIGFTTAGTPAQVLTAVDEAVDGLELSTIATAVLAELSPREDGGAVLRWSNAGHPPPALLGPDGRARLLDYGTGRADLLLGVDATSARHTEETTVPAGATLLLYTDGLIEARDHTIDDGLALLLEILERHARDGLDDLCDAVLGRMVPQGGQDDVAVVAVRPRPAEAGPCG
ncbi:GAF domain-containing SpoIIE family protein phosphatase [Blastococcus saxobsidens]|uniref:Putative Serine phosphatase RsbU, regulator of sigma subunit n=1 Tax=Blastococcus saxobsidens (strain DD2) TaxID=1146883 RepID=H6RVJ6_BLASD|nr:GAF domain-containing SpoIIE family protein phosphatase [Blastococcus saxobsidens]CCG03271.1 Putative Serine phosphatase RsbU, regulator of sigma subunit [Blastococcus saxobsidens DD2]